MMDWLFGILCALTYLLGAFISHWQAKRFYETRLNDAHSAATVAYREADVLREALADLQEEVRQERANRYIKEENEKAKRSDIARKGWIKRRAA